MPLRVQKETPRLQGSWYKLEFSGANGDIRSPSREGTGSQILTQIIPPNNAYKTSDQRHQVKLPLWAVWEFSSLFLGFLQIPVPSGYDLTLRLCISSKGSLQYFTKFQLNYPDSQFKVQKEHHKKLW